MTHATIPAAAIAVLALVASPAQTQTIFKCTDAKGQTSFQHQPCDGKRTGAIAVAPANVVDGNPQGERQVRSDAARRSEVRSAQARGELSSAMTYEEMMQTLNGPAAPVQLDGRSAPRSRYERYPSRVRCYTELEIRNATLDASSITKSDAERRAAKRLEQKMRRCTK